MNYEPINISWFISSTGGCLFTAHMCKPAKVYLAGLGIPRILAPYPLATIQVIVSRNLGL